MKSCGFSMPFSTNRRKSLLILAGATVLLGLLLFLYDQKAIYSGLTPDERKLPLLLSSAVCLPVIALYLVRCLAQLHFVPEGIAVTLFGLTIRRFPAERIRFLSAVQDARAKTDSVDLIAVCSYSLEELTQLARNRTLKLFQNSREFWPGEWAGKYLYSRAQSPLGEFNFYREILFLEWAPERLETLMTLYPHAQWLDCTQKRFFDEQLRQR